MTTPPDDRALIKQLLRSDRATLATLVPDGAPYASLVLTALDPRGLPLLLLSDLAEHTKNIGRDPRVSLLFDGTSGMAEPLAGPRLTVQGSLAPAPEKADLEHYVARHPEAAQWAALADFRLYRLVPQRAHLVAGFGRIAWIAASELFPF